MASLPMASQNSRRRSLLWSASKVTGFDKKRFLISRSRCVMERMPTCTDRGLESTIHLSDRNTDPVETPSHFTTGRLSALNDLADAMMCAAYASQSNRKPQRRLEVSVDMCSAEADFPLSVRSAHFETRA